MIKETKSDNIFMRINTQLRQIDSRRSYCNIITTVNGVKYPRKTNSEVLKIYSDANG
jgi:hypothetical protein